MYCVLGPLLVFRMLLWQIWWSLKAWVREVRACRRTVQSGDRLKTEPAVQWSVPQWINHHPARRLLFESYVPDLWWFELVNLARNQILTGVVLIIFPGHRSQLWFGLMMATFFAFVYSMMRPCKQNQDQSSL